MNPILNQMFNNVMMPFFNLFRTVKTAQNPNAMMQSMMQTNPQLEQVMNYIKKNGGNAEQLYYNVCKQRNIDPNIIINQLNNM